jgi:hypothetical protein
MPHGISGARQRLGSTSSTALCRDGNGKGKATCRTRNGILRAASAN